MTVRKPIEKTDIEEMEEILELTRAVLSDAQHRKLRLAIETLAFLTSEIEDKTSTIRRLRNLLFGSKSEKTERVLPKERDEGVAEPGGDEVAPDPKNGSGSGNEGEKKKPKGHGRNGAEKYVGAEQVEVPHESLKPGDDCVDSKCKGKLTREERLALHRKESFRPMAELRLWMWKKLRDREIEPNSGLGKAIAYMRNHWRKLTRFLFVPGAPLENNLCERTLKRCIIHRKNSLFYKTENGARVGDLYMSLIATCQLVGANPFNYLIELQRHRRESEENPEEWLPWNYREQLAARGLPSDLVAGVR